MSSFDRSTLGLLRLGALMIAIVVLRGRSLDCSIILMSLADASDAAVQNNFSAVDNPLETHVKSATSNEAVVGSIGGPSAE